MPSPVRITERDNSLSLLIGEKKLSVFQGDVKTLAADALVCPVDQNLDFKNGIAHVIGTAAGKDSRSQKPIFPEPLGKVVVLPGGRLKVKYIFLTVLLGEKDPTKMKFSIRQAVDRTIRYAEFLRLKSIAFPVLGCPKTTPPYSMVAREMLEDIVKYFQQRRTKVKLILLSAFNGNAYAAFRSEAKSLANS